TTRTAKHTTTKTIRLMAGFSASSLPRTGSALSLFRLSGRPRRRAEAIQPIRIVWIHPIHLLDRSRVSVLLRCPSCRSYVRLFCYLWQSVLSHLLAPFCPILGLPQSPSRERQDQGTAPPLSFCP